MIQWEISINNTTENTPEKATGAESASAQSNEESVKPTADRWTIKRLLDWTSDYFRESGFEQPRLDAEVLLAEAFECKRIELYTRFDEEPAEAIKGKFRDWVARHADGEPVAYLVGHKEFFSLEFEVDSNVLIPRPETEHLVTETLDAIRSYGDSQSVNVVDVGTGSGCVAIAVAVHAPSTQIHACDISAEALAVAERNAATHKMAERIQFTTSDLLEGVAAPEKFQIVVSNPPYIGLSEKVDLAKSVVEFEPHQALFSSGDVGTETIARLIEQAANRLAEGGFLIFELSPMIAEACRELIVANEVMSFERFVNDLAGLKRIIVARRK